MPTTAEQKKLVKKLKAALKKVSKGVENLEGDADVRAARKRLKRAQRKLRRMEAEAARLAKIEEAGKKKGAVQAQKAEAKKKPLRKPTFSITLPMTAELSIRPI